MKNTELIGKKFGKLTVIKKCDRSGRLYLECQCDCGNPQPKVAAWAHLKTGSVKSCGCLSANGRFAKKAIAPGQVFGKLSVVREVEPAGYQRKFLCRCECGREAEARLGNLISGDTRSCGCLAKKNPKGKLGVLG